jgi:hypothetical protein
MYLVSLGAIAYPLVAQQPAKSPQPAQTVSSGTTEGSTSIQGIRRMIGFPYSADRVSETTQTLADGTKITRKRLVKEYQDGQGRRREEFFMPGAESVAQDDSPEWVRIFDPIAGVSYSLYPRDRTAQKSEIRSAIVHRQTTRVQPNLTPAQPVPPRPTREDLGTQVIDGLEARGERITRTIPAGAEGNDQPMQVTSEIWTSTKPRLVLMSITNDPRNGETVMRLSNLVLDEPPAELFQVPADYTLKELQTVPKPEPPSD